MEMLSEKGGKGDDGRRRRSVELNRIDENGEESGNPEDRGRSGGEKGRRRRREAVAIPICNILSNSCYFRGQTENAPGITYHVKA